MKTKDFNVSLGRCKVLAKGQRAFYVNLRMGEEETAEEGGGIKEGVEEGGGVWIEGGEDRRVKLGKGGWGR